MERGGVVVNGSELHKLDGISMKLGELTAYVHEHRHGVNNLSQKLDGLSLQIAKEIAAMEARLEVKMKELETRVLKLELDEAKVDGGKGVMLWVLNSPVVAWLLALVTLAWAWFQEGHTPHGH